MRQEYKQDEEQLWWVQYVMKVSISSSGSEKDIDSYRLSEGKVYAPNPHKPNGNAPEAGSQCVPLQGNAFFYAIDEEALAKQIAGWQHYSQHDGVVVQEIKAVPPDFKLRFYGLLQELPALHRIVEDVTPYLEDKPAPRRKADRLMCAK